MSTGIVEVPILGVAAFMIAPVAIPLALTGLAIGAAGRLAGATANYTAQQRSKMEEERQKIERARRVAQEKEMTAISKKLDLMLADIHKESAINIRTEFVAKNRALLMDSLKNISSEDSDTLDIAKYSSPAKPETPPLSPNYEELANAIFSSLTILDPPLAKANEQFINEFKSGCSSVRGKIIWENLKISYANSLHEQAKNIWRKKKIDEMAATLEGQRADDFAKLANDFLDKDRIIKDTEYTELIKIYARLLQEELRVKHNSLLAEQTEIQMRKLGYTPVRDGAKTGIAVFFNTPDPEYRIMSNVNPHNGQLSFRFVRIVGSEKEKESLSTAQKRRDKEKAKKWCENSHRLIKMIEQSSGIELAEVYRDEPDEVSDVLVIVDKNLHNNRQEAERRYNAAN